MNALKKIVFFAIAVLWTASAFASVNLINNPYFDDGSGNLSLNGWQNYDSLPYWNNSIGDGIEVQFETVATGTGKYVELDTTENSDIWQSVSGLKSGTKYELSYSYFNRRNEPEFSSDIEVYFNGELLRTTKWYQQAWTSYTDYFTYNGEGTGILTFLAVGKSDSYGGFIDNVSLKAVPIPGAALLLGSALLGVVGIRRTRTV